MKFLLMVYTDDSLLEALPEGAFDQMMHGCITHADELQARGTLIESQQLEHGSTGRTVRVRDGKTTIVDGPFAETKEILGGYNLIEADSEEDALRIAREFPWARTGSIEVRPVRDLARVRARVGA